MQSCGAGARRPLSPAGLPNSSLTPAASLGQLPAAHQPRGSDCPPFHWGPLSAPEVLWQDPFVSVHSASVTNTPDQAAYKQHIHPSVWSLDV